VVNCTAVLRVSTIKSDTVNDTVNLHQEGVTHLYDMLGLLNQAPAQNRKVS